MARSLARRSEAKAAGLALALERVSSMISVRFLLQPGPREARRTRRIVGVLLCAIFIATGCGLKTAGARYDGQFLFERGRVRLTPNRKLLPKNVRVDKAQVDKRLQAMQGWFTQALVAGYDRHGARNVRWDDAVRTGFTLLARSWALDPARPGDIDDQAWRHLRRAVDLGCDDPLVEYALARLSGSDFDRAEVARRIIGAAMRLEQTAYSAFLRGHAFLTGSQTLTEASRNVPREEWDRNWKVLWALVDKSFDLLPAVLAEKDLPSPLVFRYVTDMHDQYGDSIQRDRQKIFDMTMPLVIKARGEQDPVLPVLRGRFYASYAWDARGNGFQDTVKEDNWPVFFERLERAEAEVARAVAIGSQDPAIPKIMSTVAQGLHQDRGELDDWYEIGRKLEPGDYWWYARKLDWLQARWYGSDEELLDFARSLRKEGHWGARAPMALLDAHELVATGPPRQRDYFVQQDVCDEISALYDDFLTRYPDAGYDRSMYAMRLANCGRWKDADRQFQLLTPDRVRVGVFGGRANFEARRRLAASRGR
jgi:hypothetical protein